MDSHPAGVPADDFGPEVLRHKVCAILRTRDLVHRDGLPGTGVLQPENIHVNMTNFLEATSFNDSFGGSRVQAQVDLALRPALVFDQRIDPQGFRRTTNYSKQLNFR